jgi:hypothetical protein
VGHAVHIAGSENETPSQLERIFSQFVLTVSSGLGPLARECVVFAKKVKQRGFLKAESAIGFALLIDQQWKRDSRFFAEGAGVMDIAQANCNQPRAPVLEPLLILAQLRDALAAENSTVVTQKYYDCRPLRPQRAQLDRVAINVGQGNAGKLAAERIIHGQTFSVWQPSHVKVSRWFVLIRSTHQSWL